MHFRIVEVDLDAGIVDIEFGDGTRRRGMLGEQRWRSESAIRRFRLDFVAGELVMRLPNGSDAPVELCLPGRSASALLADRLVVYLDQNLWSQLAAARHGQSDPDAADAAAAARLAQLVQDRRIVLPVSSAHFQETGRHLGENRLRIASTLLELSRGWQMRHPGMVGLTELAAGICGHQPPTRPDVFTLEPNATFLSLFPPPDMPYPEPLGSIMSHVVAASGTYDAMVDDSPIPDEGGEAAKQAWATAQDDLVQLLTSDGASSDMVRRTAFGRLLLDYAEQSLRRPDAGFDMAAFESWMPDAQADLAKMPYLGRLWRLTFARLRNGAPWNGNDLNDIHNLCAAAGYAALVAGEKRTIGDLRTVRGVTSGAALATSVPEVVAALGPLVSTSAGATGY